MKIELTKRDKTLLYVMLLVIVVFCFVYLIIIPKMDKADTLETDIEVLQAEEMTMKLAIENLAEVASLHDQAGKNLDASLASFYDNMLNYEVDKMIVSILQGKHGLLMESLEMSDKPSGIMLEPYLYSFINVAEVNVDNMPILTTTINITASGSKENIEKAIDDLFVNYPAIRVERYAFVSGRAITEGETVEMILQVYMK